MRTLIKLAKTCPRVVRTLLNRWGMHTQVQTKGFFGTKCSQIPLVSFQWMDFFQDSEDEDPHQVSEDLPQVGENVAEQVGMHTQVQTKGIYFASNVHKPLFFLPMIDFFQDSEDEEPRQVSEALQEQVGENVSDQVGNAHTSAS